MPRRAVVDPRVGEQPTPHPAGQVRNLHDTARACHFSAIWFAATDFVHERMLARMVSNPEDAVLNGFLRVLLS